MEKLNSLKRFNWSLFMALVLLSFAPAIYQTVRTFLISTNTNQEVFNIIGQMEWFDLINESIHAFLIVPIYSVFNGIRKRSNDEFKDKVFKYGLLVFILYALFQIIVFIYGTKLVRFMTDGSIDIEVTVKYLMLETIAFSIGIIIQYINVIFVLIGKAKNIYIFIVSNAVMMILSDFYMIPNFGIYGIAYSNILINIVLSIIMILVLKHDGFIKLSLFKKDDLIDLKAWSKRGIYSGFQIVVSNVVYALMVVKMINMVSNQGTYWLANNFIWGWLLIPTYALAEVIKRDSIDGYKELKQKNYYTIILLVVLLWLVTIPTWNTFFNKVQGIENYQEVTSVVLKLLPFYVFYGLNVIPDSIFIGLGKTNYLLVSAMTVNFIYYGIFYLLYKARIIVMSLNMIIIMFGMGMVISLVIKWLMEYYLLKKN